MKIHSQGRIPQPANDQPWWLRCKIRCERCSTVYQLEDGDPVDVMTERSLNGESIAKSHCPTCNTLNTTYRSKAQMIVYRGINYETR